ncbi:hypothetical protein LZF95_20785 [Algoriphagus sp. AGSA1]|uniref:hypothetical protein n=1 Tax=Algoriphagus sp. AGSA1 TaxID=2907213 RepID=UPI001F460E4B|nr:hypothetical protein [Algoriphagus sp. AGSA1]MCE7057130.1 hypothetical protein [Algoriphagus sp. AGSA1]
MIIQTSTAQFLIKNCDSKVGCVTVSSDSLEELNRFFGSLQITSSHERCFPYAVCACKQEFSNALILMVKEIDYSDFSQYDFSQF